MRQVLVLKAVVDDVIVRPLVVDFGTIVVKVFIVIRIPTVNKKILVGLGEA